MDTLIDTGTSSLIVIPDYADIDMDKLLALELVHYPPIKVFGKEGIQHRDVGFFSDESKGYRYSGQIITSKPLKKCPGYTIMDDVNEDLGTSFNGILVNRYANGDDYIGAHSDDESALSGNMVAGLSFGATRKFRIRDKKTGHIVLDYKWEHGTLIVMKGDFQKEFTHEIPVQRKVELPRISLTFRKHTQ